MRKSTAKTTIIDQRGTVRVDTVGPAGVAGAGEGGGATTGSRTSVAGALAGLGLELRRRFLRLLMCSSLCKGNQAVRAGDHTPALAKKLAGSALDSRKSIADDVVHQEQTTGEQEWGPGL